MEQDPVPYLGIAAFHAFHTRGYVKQQATAGPGERLKCGKGREDAGFGVSRERASEERAASDVPGEASSAFRLESAAREAQVSDDRWVV